MNLIIMTENKIFFTHYIGLSDDETEIYGYDIDGDKHKIFGGDNSKDMFIRIKDYIEQKNAVRNSLEQLEKDIIINIEWLARR